MTYPAGHQMLASEVNSLINPTRVGCTLRRFANQSVTQNVTTSISWDTADENTPVSFITVTSATITIPSGYAGVYAITFQVGGNVDTPATFNGAGSRFLAICAVTSTYTYPAEFRGSVALGGTEDLAVLSLPSLRLAVGDSFVLRTFHNSAAAVNMTGWASCYRVSL